MQPVLKNKNLILFFLLCGFVCHSQTEEQKKQLSLYEDSLKKIQKDIFKAKNDGLKRLAGQQFGDIVERALNVENSFNFPFDSLKDVARLVSPDKKLRIINWNLPLDDGTHEYYGYIQAYNAKTKKYDVFKLVDRSADVRNPETYTSDHSKWYGMLYYKIILGKINKKPVYTLLAWDGNDKISNKKIIDVLSFNSNGVPQFGMDIFKMEKRSPKRVVFEFVKDASMSLKYDEKKNRIIFDHLAPPDESLKGQFQFYGPDFSFDGLKFEKGFWIYIRDIDARNEKNKKDDTYIDPKGDKTPIK